MGPEQARAYVQAWLVYLSSEDPVRLCTSCHVLQRIPERIVEKAVKGMLPKGRLGNRLFTHLKVGWPGG